MTASRAKVAAVIAAAGRSRRMGEPKQLLPWGDGTVIATVVANLTAAGAAPILCVTGHRAADIASALTATTARILYNADYRNTEMLRSYQRGIEQLLTEDEVVGALLALGDQPHIPAAVIGQVVVQALQTPTQIVIPSYQMRRGHPFYMPRQLWPDLLSLDAEETLRVVLKRHSAAIRYVNVEDDAILRDMDTPAAYQALRARQEADDQQRNTQ